MSAGFKDHFSDRSRDYSAFRPGYPAELFSYLSTLAPAQQLAWDCATGSGQAALALSEFFSEVIATDASENQLRLAPANDSISYRVEPAEQTSLQAASVDLITVAQSLHWFDIDTFAAEARRVLKPAGVLAAWSYNLLQAGPKLDECIKYLYNTVLADYWPAERRLVEQGYRDIQLPFKELTPPSFAMQADWQFDQLVGYLCTWSASKRYEQDKGDNPVEALYDDLSCSWGDPAEKKLIEWPLVLRIWVNSE